MRAHCQLSRADLEPNSKGFDSNHLPVGTAGVQMYWSRRRVEAHCSYKSRCWWLGRKWGMGLSLCQSQHTSSSVGAGMKATHLKNRKLEAGPHPCQLTKPSGQIPTICKAGGKITTKQRAFMRTGKKAAGATSRKHEGDSTAGKEKKARLSLRPHHLLGDLAEVLAYSFPLPHNHRVSTEPKCRAG